MLPSRPRVSRPMRKFARPFATYALLGVVLTYASTAIAVGLLLVPTHSYSCTGAIHRAELGEFQPYLRLRVWTSPHGSYFQIHRTTSRALQLYADAVPADRRDAWLKNPKLDDVSFIPSWSVLREDWPTSLYPLVPLFEEPAMWYEVLMGWPIPCLYGRYTVGQSTAEQIRTADGVIPIYRTLKWATGNTTRDLVVMPLIPNAVPFIASVALYGGSLFVAVSVMRAMRRWHRRRGGLCPECGYDLRASPERCPECGRAS